MSSDSLIADGDASVSGRPCGSDDDLCPDADESECKHTEPTSKLQRKRSDDSYDKTRYYGGTRKHKMFAAAGCQKLREGPTDAEGIHDGAPKGIVAKQAEGSTQRNDQHAHKNARCSVRGVRRIYGVPRP